MSNIKTIKRRIKSSKNIAQITKAMEMVAASKMRRSQERALASRPYANKVDTILKRMSGLIDPQDHQLLQDRKQGDTNTIAILALSPDKGLCGGLNSNLFRSLEGLEKTLSEKHSHIPISFTYISVGKKVREYILKTGRNLHAEFTIPLKNPTYEDVLPISKILLDGFKTNHFFKVYILYNDFISTISQKPASGKLLPLDTEELAQGLFKESEQNYQKQEYIFEPSSSKILDWLLPYYFELQIYQKVLEGQAAEHSARMVSMRNASDNAKDIVKYLQLEYNQKRQAAITNEIADIVTSRQAVT